MRGHLRRPGQPARGRQGTRGRALQEQRLRPVPRLPGTAGTAGHRRGPDRHRRPLACAGVDPRGPGRQGRLQRKALRPDHRGLPGAGRYDEPFGRVFQAGTQRRSVANFQRAVQACPQRQARQAPHALRLGLHARQRLQLAARGAGARPGRGGLGYLAGPAPWRPYNHSYVQGGWRGYYDFDSGATAPGLGCAHRRSLPVGQPGRRHHARRVRADRHTA